MDANVMMLDLAAAKLAELSLKVFPHGIPQAREALPLTVAEADRYIAGFSTVRRTTCALRRMASLAHAA